jgi:hypothetical protein
MEARNMHKILIIRLAMSILLPVLLLACSRQPATTLAAADLTASPTSSCPITSPSSASFIPPTPYPSTPPGDYLHQFWYGTADLWVLLRADGTWSGLPRASNGYSQKVFWFSSSYDINAEPAPNLTVTGKRLDASSPQLAASAATNALADFGPAMLTGVELPSPGCWKLTGSYKSHDLSFVVWVAP